MSDNSPLEERLAEEPRPDLRPRIHGNGFIQLDLSPTRHLHIFGVPGVPKQKAETPIHDHTFGFTSRVLFGALQNSVFTFEPDPDGIYAVHQARVRDREDTILEDTGERWRCVRTDVETIRAGESYRMEPGVFHESIATTPTITIIDKTGPSLAQGGPSRVLVPLGMQHDNEFNRYALPASTVWMFIVRALLSAVEAGPSVPLPASSKLQDQAGLGREAQRLEELRAYLDTLTITGETIGGIRRSLMMPYACAWNGIVRDETAKREGARVTSPSENRTHGLERTSPKGGPFIGRCIYCGTEGLPSRAALESCAAAPSQDQQVLDAIAGPDSLTLPASSPQSTETDPLILRLRLHAHDLVNGGTNASELRADLMTAAEWLAQNRAEVQRLEHALATERRCRMEDGYSHINETAEHARNQQALKAVVRQLTEELNAERLEVIGAIARKEAAQREAANLREVIERLTAQIEQERWAWTKLSELLKTGGMTDPAFIVGQVQALVEDWKRHRIELPEWVAESSPAPQMATVKGLIELAHELKAAVDRTADHTEWFTPLARLFRAVEELEAALRRPVFPLPQEQK